MSQISYFYYSLALLIRDRYFSLFIFFLTGVISYFLILSLNIQTLLSGLSKTSVHPVYHVIPDYFQFFCLTSLALISIIKVVYSQGDTGVMLAIGGSRIGCLLILLHKEVILLLSASLAAFIVQLVFVPDSFLSDLLFREIFLNLARAIGQLLSVSLSAAIISGIFITGIDPYQSIRRQK